MKIYFILSFDNSSNTTSSRVDYLIGDGLGK